MGCFFDGTVVVGWGFLGLVLFALCLCCWVCDLVFCIVVILRGVEFGFGLLYVLFVGWLLGGLTCG